MSEFVPMWKRSGSLPQHRIIGCMDCKRIAFQELTGKKPFRNFKIRWNNSRNDAALLERKFKNTNYGYGLGSKARG